ncbi:MAG: PilN domain-containing protein [Burkholderiales bacterium]|nr:PilN domain-containing protein [Burkholderiales bacterium]
MILINLLPHREARRARRKQAFFATLGAAAVAGAVAAGAWWTAVEQARAAQDSRNDFLGAEIKRLEAQIKDIASLREEIDALKARQAAVEDLQNDRNIPVYLLDELVRHAPEGVYLTAIRQTGSTVAVTGVAQTNERVSEMLRNASYNATWLERPELVEIKAANVTTTGREARRLYEFSMRLSIKRPQPAGETGDAPAGAPARATGTRAS